LVRHIKEENMEKIEEKIEEKIKEIIPGISTTDKPKINF